MGLCVHNLVRSGGGVMYQQNHYGVWRSEDDAKSWQAVNEGLPSTFGFPVGVHPRDPRMVWTLPLNGDMAGRFPPDAAATDQDALALEHLLQAPTAIHRVLRE